MAEILLDFHRSNRFAWKTNGSEGGVSDPTEMLTQKDEDT